MKMNWSEENILAFGTAAILHDIGKSRISPEILYKTSPLADDEFRLGTAPCPERRNAP